MVNIIWVLLTVIGIIFAMVNGTMEEVNEAIFKGAAEAVTLCIGLISVLVFWLRNYENSGGCRVYWTKLSHIFRPTCKRLFPEIPNDHPAMGYILSNMMANLFGLGNAATPLGIKAMEQMKELNGGKT